MAAHGLRIEAATGKGDAMSELAPHQQRVVTEEEELRVKTIALGHFFENPLFQKLDEAEQARLKRQWKLMQQYGQVLNERIDAFHR